MGQTVVLHHVSRTDSHYDWLIDLPALASPADGDADDAADLPRLWAARVRVPSHAWESAGAFAVQVIEPHRRIYLTYQGPLSAERGRVRQIDRGMVTPLLLSRSRLILDIAMERFRGCLELHRLDGNRWRAVLLAAGTDRADAAAQTAGFPVSSPAIV